MFNRAPPPAITPVDALVRQVFLSSFEMVVLGVYEVCPSAFLQARTESCNLANKKMIKTTEMAYSLSGQADVCTYLILI